MVTRATVGAGTQGDGLVSHLQRPLTTLAPQRLQIHFLGLVSSSDTEILWVGLCDTLLGLMTTSKGTPDSTAFFSSSSVVILRGPQDLQDLLIGSFGFIFSG